MALHYWNAAALTGWLHNPGWWCSSVWPVTALRVCSYSLGRLYLCLSLWLMFGQWGVSKGSLFKLEKAHYFKWCCEDVTEADDHRGHYCEVWEAAVRRRSRPRAISAALPWIPTGSIGLLQICHNVFRATWMCRDQKGLIIMEQFTSQVVVDLGYIFELVRP